MKNLPITVKDERPKKGISFEENWPVSAINEITQLTCGHNINNVYNFKIIKEFAYQNTEEVLGDLNDDRSSVSELDEFLWNEVVGVLEESRTHIFETLKVYNLSEGEAYFQSIKFIMIVFKHLRISMWLEFGGKESEKDYQKTALRNAIIGLGRRFDVMQVKDSYLYSLTAINEDILSFLKSCAKETARILIEEKGVAVYAKLTL